MLKRLPLILLPLLLLGACANPVQDNSASLKGYFKSTYGDGFEVTSSTFTYYGDPEAKGVRVVGDMGFSGTIENPANLTSSAGTLTVKVTSAGKSGPTVGKYTVVAWKDLSQKGVIQSTPYKSGSNNHNGMDTQAAAEAELTVANGYFFGYPAEYLRQ